MDKTIQTLTEVLQMSKEGTKPYDTTAEVVRIEGQTAWVHIPGGIDETPVSMTIDARVGDIVQVRVSGGRAWITGNASAPPTDDKKATAAQKSADKAKDTADNAEELAAKANRAAQKVNQYFWHTETDTGAGAGAHITEVTQDEFLDDPDNGGGNLLAQSGGIVIRDGLTEIAKFTGDLTSQGAPRGKLNLSTDVSRLEGYTWDSGINVYTETSVLAEDAAQTVEGAVKLWAGDNTQNCTAGLYAKSSDNGIASIEVKKTYGASGSVEIDASGNNSNLNCYIPARFYKDIYINNQKVVDYVIERGTSGNWKYIKWHSGRVECEGYYTFPSLSFSASGNMYRSVSNAFTIPSGIFTTAPTEGQAWIQGSNTVYLTATIGGLTTTGGNCQIWKSTSGSATDISVHMRIVYR